MTWTWTCPSCGTEWGERPLVEEAIGCPECGSISEDAVEGWGRCIQALRLELPAEVWADVKARSDRALARLSAAEQALRQIAGFVPNLGQQWQPGRAKQMADIARAALAGREERR